MTPSRGEIRAVELVDPAPKAQIALATNAAGPGSPIARALVASAQQLALDEFFDAQLRGHHAVGADRGRLRAWPRWWG